MGKESWLIYRPFVVGNAKLILKPYSSFNLIDKKDVGGSYLSNLPRQSSGAFLLVISKWNRSFYYQFCTDDFWFGKGALMTITTAWVRTAGKVNELVIISDSRLRFGCAWDCCPKILPTPRNDSVIAFAGDTMHTYPLMLQAIASMSNHRSSLSREYDLGKANKHLLRMFESMRGYMSDPPIGGDIPLPECKFIFGGYCWRTEKFKTWTYRFDGTAKQFIHHKNRKWGGATGKKIISIIGYPSVNVQENKRAAKQGKEIENVKFDVVSEMYNKIAQKMKDKGTLVSCQP